MLPAPIFVLSLGSCWSDVGKTINSGSINALRVSGDGQSIMTGNVGEIKVYKFQEGAGWGAVSIPARTEMFPARTDILSDTNGTSIAISHDGINYAFGARTNVDLINPFGGTPYGSSHADGSSDSIVALAGDGLTFAYVDERIIYLELYSWDWGYSLSGSGSGSIYRQVGFYAEEEATITTPNTTTIKALLLSRDGKTIAVGTTDSGQEKTIVYTVNTTAPSEYEWIPVGQPLPGSVESVSADGAIIGTVSDNEDTARIFEHGSCTSSNVTDLNGDTPASYVSTCADAAAKGGYIDGLYLLYLRISAIDLNPSTKDDATNWPLGRFKYEPFEVYCHLMSSNKPRAYLNVNNSTNFATWIYGNTTLTTRFSKVRFDEETQMIYSADYTFALLDEIGDGGADPCDTSSGGCTFLPNSSDREFHCVNNSFRAPLGSAANWWNPGNCESTSCNFAYDENAASTREGKFSVDFTDLANVSVVNARGGLVWILNLDIWGDEFAAPFQANNPDFVFADQGNSFTARVGYDDEGKDDNARFGCINTVGTPSGEVLSSRFNQPAMALVAPGEETQGDVCTDAFAEANVNVSKLRTVYDIEKLMNMSQNDVVDLFDAMPTGPVAAAANWYKTYCTVSESLNFELRADEFPFDNDFKAYLGAGGWGMPLCIAGDGSEQYYKGNTVVSNATDLKPVNCLSDANSKWHGGTATGIFTSAPFELLQYSARKVPSFEFGPPTEFYTGSTLTQCPGAEWKQRGPALNTPYSSNSFARISSDGSHVAFGSPSGAENEIQVFEFDGSTTWSPIGQVIDGKRIDPLMDLSDDGHTLIFVDDDKIRALNLETGGSCGPSPPSLTSSGGHTHTHILALTFLGICASLVAPFSD